jgi:hypothetical protein
MCRLSVSKIRAIEKISRREIKNCSPRVRNPEGDVTLGKLYLEYAPQKGVQELY